MKKFILFSKFNDNHIKVANLSINQLNLQVCQWEIFWHGNPLSGGACMCTNYYQICWLQWDNNQLIALNLHT